VGGTVLRIVTRLNRGGPLRQLTALVPGLRRLGWDGPVVCGQVEAHESDGSVDLEAAGAQVVRLRALGRGLDPSRDPRALKALAALVRRHRPDVVHTHMGKAGALGRLAAHLAGVPAVHTFHGHHLEAAPGVADLARWAERLLGRVTAAAIALTPRQRRDLVEVHRVLPAGKVHVVGPGMDLEAFRRRARAPRRGVPGLPADGRLQVLWTGRFVPVKDPLRLVEAAALARAPVHVTLLGRGPLRGAVRAAVRARGLEARVSCPGSVADVAPWVQAADALVCCSRSEGAPLSVLEACALGKPVVVTTVGGVPDLVRHEGEGLWVPPGDARALARALDRLAGDPELRRRLGAAGRALADARFGAERLAASTAALYERL
jgi:glycosyltransferase involved in cell wall biosynthesis